MWLLCLVVGWLWVPTYTSHEFESAIGYGNTKRVEGTEPKACPSSDRTLRWDTLSLLTYPRGWDRETPSVCAEPNVDRDIFSSLLPVVKILPLRVRPSAKRNQTSPRTGIPSPGINIDPRRCSTTLGPWGIPTSFVMFLGDPLTSRKEGPRSQ